MITDEEVRKIHKLAHLHVDERELPEFVKKLGAILGYVAQLERIDVAGVDPMSHVHGSTNEFRSDVVQPSLSFDDVSQDVPDRSGKFIRVPLIVE